ncbi:hypothetical protein ACVIHI_005421 [Bradyrhizobium sp. USDA 4524]|nr:hypothetical protein [Bradyrhizobium sp. USDA 4538]MCP1902221.1 hypothetical protein [Bradyrhizobium sp. USDA 4537]MCP1992122.1 hypothetical protein [Bradyrhizobium sp. USDA 4539]
MFCRSPDGAERNPGTAFLGRFPDFAPLHPGYALCVTSAA